MKKSLLLYTCLLLLGMSVAAQTTETVKVAAGNDIAAAVSAWGIYRLPVFTSGTIFFNDGKMGKEVMNYNILNDQMLYVSKTGDTLAVAFPEEIKKIDLGGVVFYYEKNGWLESVAAAANIQLAVKRKITIHFAKEGAFGISNSTNGIDSYTTFTSNNASYHLFVGEDAILKKLTSFFLLAEGSQALPATKNNFMNRFAKNKNQIDHYLERHKVNFNKEADLRQLLAVIGTEQ